MSTISYEDVIRHHKNISSDLKRILGQIEEMLINGRDYEKIPIYLTKYRVKSADSIFLKTKRKNYSSLEEITDYAGLRVLCLFEQDLISVHSYILQTLLNHTYKLKQFRLFNWPKHEPEGMSLFSSAKERYNNLEEKDVFVDRLHKPSGYKSVHYIYSVLGTMYLVEIQLRTLLQDVWGELEHSLSYKQGNIHPHIKKSFVLLANDLENNDRLLSHLKIISERERVVIQYAKEKAGPTKWISYENDVVPNAVKNNSEYVDKFNKYYEFMKKINPLVDKENNIKEAIKAYRDARKLITSDDDMEDKTSSYFVKMEAAYLLFWEGKYQKALEIYNTLESDYSEQYVLYFRIGEIYFIIGNIVRALVAFDKSESLLQKYDSLNIIDQVEIKFKLSYIYWLLGSDYIGYSTKISDEIEEIISQNRDKFIESYKNKSVNNSCAYYLDKYLAAISDDKEKLNVDKYFDMALAKFNTLKALLHSDNATAGMFDTAAWFSYNLYLRTRNQDDLEQAKKFCKQIADKENKATLRIISHNIQISHIQEIMSAK